MNRIANSTHASQVSVPLAAAYPISGGMAPGMRPDGGGMRRALLERRVNEQISEQREQPEQRRQRIDAEPQLHESGHGNRDREYQRRARHANGPMAMGEPACAAFCHRPRARTID